MNFNRDLNFGVVDDVGFDSYMLSSEDMSLGNLRLLDVDNRCVIPRVVRVGFLIGSEDVIHS
ncbi:unnamed protein product [Dracunculus medinensis]|uniref:COX2_CUA domain-containing protein n=1 Tax=Dracunculus medinensis TaxID=318479 RepID=A0A0N4U2H6_DRAME|nr:unnamed protein product [Dracunculus medinensis]